jgi:GNAT superfamily N-acetyltransferase
MASTTYQLHLTRSINPVEFGRLASLAHWGAPEDFTQERLEEHFAAVAFVAHVRSDRGELVGYASALSNGLHAVFVDSLLIHPEFDGDVISGLLLKAVLDHFAGTPVYGLPFVDEQDLFRNQGFKVYRREMVALANRNDKPL